ncbi:MAG TPA: ABC transporter permease subunit, partial [Vicinamibacterales bacterium]|nr:ABC transporter permease subunit [Vicinamibacterales bacterium]
MASLFHFWSLHASELWTLLGQHVALVVVSTAAAVAVGVPVGIIAARRPRVGAPIAAAASIIQTVPSLALFGFLLPLPLVGGVGARTALAALVLYALLPVIRTTAAGIRSIDSAILEAADAMGMTSRQRLTKVELPLALPAIMAGVRVSAVVGVGTVTIAAAIGAGGLGEYIYRGLSMVDATVILAGAVPVAALAMVVDGGLLVIERALSTRRPLSRITRVVAAAAAVVAGAAVAVAATPGAERIVVGSKNFTEQVILGELMAQAIERYAALPVDRRLNLGGTFICDR